MDHAIRCSGGSAVVMFHRFRVPLSIIRRFSHTKASRLVTDNTGLQQSIELTESAVKVIVSFDLLFLERVYRDWSSLRRPRGMIGY